MLPDGTGFDLISFIKGEKLGPFQIVVVTGAESSLLTKIDRSIVKTVMFKPVDAEHFARLIRSLVV